MKFSVTLTYVPHIYQFVFSYFYFITDTSNANCSVKSLSLPIFGLASYKLKSNIWTKEEPSGTEHLDSLLQEAEKWLKQVHVDHPDFRFFVTHYNTNLR
jgi:Protein of unknown function (DUF789)